MLIQCIAVTYLFYLIGGLAAFGIGAYIFGIKAAKEVQIGLEILDIKLKSRDEVKKSVKYISVFVHYHSIMKQLSFVSSFPHFQLHFSICSFREEIKIINPSHSIRLARKFAEFFQPIFMMSLSWCTISICGAMLLVQVEIVQYRPSVFEMCFFWFRLYDFNFFHFTQIYISDTRASQLLGTAGIDIPSMLFIWPGVFVLRAMSTHVQ